MSGAVTTAMSAGIIPICSKTCGYDKEEVIILNDCSLETIRNSILDYSKKPWEWIEKKSIDVVELSQTKYSWKSFSLGINDALKNI